MSPTKKVYVCLLFLWYAYDLLPMALSLFLLLLFCLFISYLVAIYSASQKCKIATTPATHEPSHNDSGDAVASHRSVSPVVDEYVFIFVFFVCCIGAHVATRHPTKHVKTTARISTGGHRPHKELLSPVTIMYAFFSCYASVDCYIFVQCQFPYHPCST